MKYFLLFFIQVLVSPVLLLAMHADKIACATMCRNKLQYCIDSLIKEKIIHKNYNGQNGELILFREPVDTIGNYIKTTFDLSLGSMVVAYEQWKFDSKLKKFISCDISSAQCYVKLHKKNKINVMYITRVNTLMHYQRQGYATKVLASIWPKLQKAGYAEVRLYSVQDYREWYQRQGFSLLVKNKQHKYQPLILMTKLLLAGESQQGEELNTQRTIVKTTL